MDRFIEYITAFEYVRLKNLKSNMDRFIDVCVPFLSHPFTI